MALLKYLLIVFLIFWLISKAWKFLFRGLLWFMGAKTMAGAAGQGQQQRRTRQRPSDGNVEINYNPKNKKDKNTHNFKGGEYVDYEEVKE